MVCYARTNRLGNSSSTTRVAPSSQRWETRERHLPSIRHFCVRPTPNAEPIVNLSFELRSSCPHARYVALNDTGLMTIVINICRFQVYSRLLRNFHLLVPFIPTVYRMATAVVVRVQQRHPIATSSDCFFYLQPTLQLAERS